MTAPAIRPLGPADASAYKRLRDACLLAAPEAFTSDHASEALRGADSYAPRLAPPDTGQFTLGAFAADELIGAITCARERGAKNRHVAQVVGMMVLPRAQRGGVGAALVARLTAQARALDGLDHLVLTVTAGNAHTVRLYERAGYAAFGLHRRAIRVDGRYHDKLHMALDLHPLAA